tara:strand:+ start:475 stop:795 length:321 start_codon:yes stop_codon:yes gene_type:complete
MLVVLDPLVVPHQIDMVEVVVVLVELDQLAVHLNLVVLENQYHGFLQIMELQVVVLVDTLVVVVVLLLKIQHLQHQLVGKEVVDKDTITHLLVVLQLLKIIPHQLL